eukprot:symbB.v1.2.002711.t1/scaffold145.1/size471898/13
MVILVDMVSSLSWSKSQPGALGHWSCSNLEQLDREALQELRGFVGRLAYQKGLAAIIYEGSRYSLIYRDYLETARCSVARWTVELLVAQLASQRLDEKTGSWTTFMGFDATPLAEPLSIFFRPKGLSIFQALLWGSGASWAQVGQLGWGTFALLSMLSHDFQALLWRTNAPLHDRSIVEALKPLWPKEEMLEVAGNLPSILSTALAHLKLVNRSNDWTLEALSSHVVPVEQMLRQWSREAVVAGLHSHTVISLLLADSSSEEFWRLLDEMMLPDAVEICFSEAVQPTEVDTRAFAHCHRRHCDPLWGKRASMTRASSILPNTSRAVFRLEPRRGFFSDNLRSACIVRCSPQVLEVLNAAASLSAEDFPQFHFVDIGAALGDCMVFAGGLFQQRLVGLSYEALRIHAKLSKETFQLNLGSSVRLRELALGSKKGALHGQVNHAGFGQVHINFTAQSRVLSSTLDSAQRSSGMSRIDLLSMFVNHAESQVLDGSQDLLMQQQVGCVLVCTYGFENHSTDAIGRLELLGYAAFGSYFDEVGGGFWWVKACPASDWLRTHGDRATTQSVQ